MGQVWYDKLDHGVFYQAKFHCDLHTLWSRKRHPITA